MVKQKGKGKDIETPANDQDFGEESFEQLMAESFKPTVSLSVGDEVEAVIIGLDSESVFLDVGTRLDGVLKRSQLSAKQSKELEEGQTLKVFIAGQSRGAWQCSYRLGGGGVDAEDPQQSAALIALEDAFNRNSPIEGNVAAVTKGGFEVRIMGQKAFCPISQIDKQYCENPEDYVNKNLTFEIVRFEEDGKNIVVSRREYLAHEAAKVAEKLWEKLEEDAVYEGVVTAIKNFGVFVDIGGIDGLLHISEISYQRNVDIEQQFKTGQKIKVAIKSIDRVKRRIGLSLKPLMEDPWTAAIKKLTIGGEFEGKVVRMKTFGAFIELFPGVDGLVHISRLGTDRRHQHPKEVLKLGEIVTVRIMEIDEENKKISLTMEKEEQDYSDDLKRLKKQQEETTKSAPTAMAGLFDDAMNNE